MNLDTTIESLIWKYFEDKASENEMKSISDWLNQSKANRHTFAAMKKAFIEIEADTLKDREHSENAYGRFIKHIERIETHRAGERTSRVYYIRKSLRIYAAAILLAIMLGFGSYFILERLNTSSDDSYCEITVPYGGKSSIVLPDGSKVWLNAGSNLKYKRDFDVKSREVKIEGEAFFDVQKMRHPFVVHTSHFDIRVLGTTFNVKSYPDDDNIETTLIEGNIRIESNELAKPLNLKPRQKMTYYKGTEQVKTSSLSLEKPDEEASEISQPIDKTIKKSEIAIEKIANPEEYTGWKDGQLIINNEPLGELVKKLERKYDIVFRFESEDLRYYTYSGTIRDFPLEQVLKALELTSPIKYVINEKNVTLSLNKDFSKTRRN